MIHDINDVKLGPHCGEKEEKIQILFGAISRIKSKAKRNRIKRILKAVLQEIDQQEDFPPYTEAMKQDACLLIGFIGRPSLMQAQHIERKRVMNHFLRKIWNEIKMR